MSRLDSKDNHYTSFSLVQQAPKPVRWLLDEIMADLDNLLGELGQEMRAIADYWQIDLGIVVTLNFAYELREVCVCTLPYSGTPLIQTPWDPRLVGCLDFRV